MDPYISRIFVTLGNHDPISVLEHTPRALEQLVEGFFDVDFERSYAPGKWSARQILAHLADVELGLGFRIRQALTIDNYVAQSFDQDAWAARYDRLEPTVALEAFRALRSWNLALFATFDASDWGRPVRYPIAGVGNVDEMVRFLAGHDLNHLKQLQQIAQRL